jgi:KipI family sensor histidine kinase inhibitor
VSDGLRVLPVGDAALSLELGQELDPALADRVRALDAALAERPLPGLCETVPTVRALLVCYDPARTSFAELGAALRERARTVSPRAEPGRRHEVPVRYGGEDGPDLAELSRARGLREPEVIRLHASVEYTALMLGFMPGFAYLGLLPEPLRLARRATPRTRVPAGSVAVAAAQTAIYPAPTPGGWHLIGRAAVRLFDPAAHPPALIAPGDRVRFRPVDHLASPVASPAMETPSGAAPALQVLEPGLLTTVQDHGRFGQRRWGVGWAGAMDAPALAAANVAVGNPPEAAGLECTLQGPRLLVRAPVHFAVSGSLGAVLHRADLGEWRVAPRTRVLARPGNVLAFERDGLRAWVAFAGGIDVPGVLGSRSTDLAGGFGGYEGRPLREGDLLAVGPRPRLPAEEMHREEAVPAGGDTLTLRVVLGPQEDHFTAEALRVFFASAYGVHESSDRVGCRLEGPPLAHSGPAEIVSDGMLPGCVQVPPDGQPIVTGPDSPTTGGYPKVATVITADLPRLAALRPGRSQVRFERVTLEEAARARR